MTKGFIIETVELPASCSECVELNGTYGYCLHVGRCVDCYIDINNERYPTCPIVSYEEALKELEGVKE